MDGAKAVPFIYLSKINDDNNLRATLWEGIYIILSSLILYLLFWICFIYSISI